MPSISQSEPLSQSECPQDVPAPPTSATTTSSATTTANLIPNSLLSMLQQQLQQQQQQHHPLHFSPGQQTEPPAKSFVCEICGKAFRFRSNLAEHRSVHTAVKPFVCKFCGKSSRLKGNLTKHILKHHKTEQRDYIGTDDYIIKKGKKSVKDPAAIEFLERSMIVLNNSSSSSSSSSAQNNHANGGDKRSEMVDGIQQGILLSFGLDGASLDLKTESMSEASDNGCAGGQFDFGMFSANNNSERMLARCEDAIEREETGMEESEEGDEEPDEEEGLLLADENALEQQRYIGTEGRREGGGEGTPMETTMRREQGAATALAAAACKALFGQMARTDEGQGSEQQQQQQQQQQRQQSTSEASQEMLRLLAASFGQQPNDAAAIAEQCTERPQSTGGTSIAAMARPMATQCQQCGKHFRKPRDLAAHLASAHKMVTSQDGSTSTATAPSFPSSSLQLVGTSEFTDRINPPFAGITSPGTTAAIVDNNSGNSSNELVGQELRQLRLLVNELKEGLPSAKVEQMLGQLDSRVCRLEKQLEMALNSIYTLVQLQTGINNNVGKLSRFLLNNQQ